MVVLASDLDRDPGFQLSQRKNGSAFRVIVLLELDVAKRRARQDVNGPHHRADEPLNMPAEPWRRGRPVLYLDSIFAACACQRARMELCPIVAVQAVRQPRDRPRQINAAFAQPGALVVNGVKEAQAHRNAGRRFKGKMKPCDHPSADVNRDRQHGTPDWSSILLVDDDNIDKSMVDLPDRVRTVSDKLPWAWGRRRLQGPLPSSAGRSQTV